MSKLKILLLFLFFFLMFTLHAVADTQHNCLPEFPYKDGWIGGDAAYSVKIGKNRSLWLFGDTFVQYQNKEISRAGSAMITNTIAVSTCHEQQWQIDYYWQKKGEKAKPLPFFDIPTPETDTEYRYWPLHGFVNKGKLYVAVEKIRVNKDAGPLGFELTEIKLAVVDNYEQNPEDWHIEYQDFTKNATVFPGVAFIKQWAHLYIFAVLDDNAHKLTHPLILLRLPLAKIERASASLEYFSKDGKWIKGLDWQNARQVIDIGSNEVSVSYNYDLQKWLAVYNKGDEFPSKHIVMRTATRLEGPWADAKVIYEVPETKTDNPDFDQETFCYAGKEHVQFSRHYDKKLVVTYACNSFNFYKLINKLDIYVPKTVLLELE